MIERMRKHTPGQPQHVTLAKETVYKNELCCAHLADGMSELPWYEPCFSRCSARSLRLAQRTKAEEDNELDTIAGMGLGRQLVWGVSEVGPGSL